MKFNTNTTFGLIAGLVLGSGITLATSVIAKLDPKVETSKVLLDELRSFTDVFARIKNDYVVETDDKKLIESAIRGMLSGLDPHSSYLDVAEFKELQVGTSGEFGGLGIEVGVENGFVRVISPIDDTPAQRAGVHAGDIIIRLDDTPIKGMSLNDAVKLMRGKPGTDITLTVVREGSESPIKITLTRAVIKVRSVKSMMLDKGYGYIRISQFQAKTGSNVLAEAKALMAQAGGKLNGLVVDMRNNPGGVLSASVEVSDAFLNTGLIVYTEGRVPDSRLRFSATEGDIVNGAPIVVLVNGASASAAEIVAGALQDHRRAIIMGEKTFGKGSVQTILPSRFGTAVKLTTARYFTPNGRSIQAKGIDPDIVVENVKFSKKNKPEVDSIKEKDLSKHLMNKAAVPADEEKPSVSKSDEVPKMLRDDYQLYQALGLLKGLHITKSNTEGTKTSVARKPVPQ